MKKLSFLFLLVSLFVLAGCSTEPEPEALPADNQWLWNDWEKLEPVVAVTHYKGEYTLYVLKDDKVELRRFYPSGKVTILTDVPEEKWMWAERTGWKAGNFTKNDVVIHLRRLADIEQLKD